jgi:IPT/TIG domain
VSSILCVAASTQNDSLASFSEVAPKSASAGIQVTITGTNLTGTTSVLFNGASARFTNASSNNNDLRIIAIVPPDATSGPITIATPHGNVTSSAIFQVLPPALSAATRDQGQIQLRWPATSAALTLEACDDLRVQHLAPVQQTPIRENGESKVNLLSLGATFYRLRSD